MLSKWFCICINTNPYSKKRFRKEKYLAQGVTHTHLEIKKVNFKEDILVCSIAHTEYSLEFPRSNLNVYVYMHIQKQHGKFYIINLNLIFHHNFTQLKMLIMYFFNE